MKLKGRRAACPFFSLAAFSLLLGWVGWERVDGTGWNTGTNDHLEKGMNTKELQKTNPGQEVYIMLLCKSGSEGTPWAEKLLDIFIFRPFSCSLFVLVAKAVTSHGAGWHGLCF